MTERYPRSPKPLVLDRLKLFSSSCFTDALGLPERIAVVGNGVVDKPSREHIEAADVVVRFNNWNSRANCSQLNLLNGGDRCDVLISHLDCQPILTPPWTPRMLVLAIPAPFRIDRNPFYLEERYQKIDVTMINPYLNRLLCLSLGFDSLGHEHPLPTVGFTFLYHVWRFSLPSRVYVCGFDWYYKPESDSFNGVSVLDKHAAANNHSSLREARWVQKTLLGDSRWSFSAAAAAALARLSSVDDLPWETGQLEWPPRGPWART